MDRRLADLVANLEARGFASDGISKWGRPVPWAIDSDATPQALIDASALQHRFVECSYGTPSPGRELCASWVEQCFSRLGLGVVLGDAATLYESFCHYTELDKLKVGMIVAVPAQPYSLAGMSHGHVGLYVGDGLVRDAVADEVRTVPLELWLTAYGLVSEPRWGWLGSIGLN